MAEITVAVINASKWDNEEVEAAVSALQTQVYEDFEPAWGIDAQLTFYPALSSDDKITDWLKDRPPQGSWWLVILDNSDLAALLGYHDLTDEGLPLGKVFAETDTLNGRVWTVSASNVLLQMLADPGLNLTALRPTSEAPGQLYTYDVCNPCKADEYEINHIRVSDFVYPSWFEWFHKPGSTQFDHRLLVKAPFELRPGGEIDVFDVDLSTRWRPLVSEGGPYEYRNRPRVGDRREQRRIPRDQWQLSMPRSMLLPGRPIPPTRPPDARPPE